MEYLSIANTYENEIYVYDTSYKINVTNEYYILYFGFEYMLELT
jgi:hypothetical protein